MADESQGVVASSRQIHVLLTLLDGERSFGMSLAQKTPPLGASYTVVSSVFANSPADRAGVRKGYVVRCINDKPMNGLTVAQVASHFRNASQAKITLEVLESMSSPRTSAFAAAATFGGVAAVMPNVQIGAGDGREKRPMTGFSPASSGRAIAAPGTALAVPRVASPKQPVLRLSAKPAAKTLAVSRPQAAGVTSTATARNAGATGRTMLRADAKVSNGENHTGLKSKVVAPVLRLGLKPKPVPEEAAQKEVPAATKKIELKSAAKSVPSNTPDAKRELETSRIPQSPIQAIEENRGTTAQANSSSALVTPAPAARANSTPQVPLVTAPKSSPSPSTLPVEMKPAAAVETTGNNALRPTPSSSTAVSTPSSQNRAVGAANTAVSTSKPVGINAISVNAISSPATIALTVAAVLPSSSIPATATTPKPSTAPARSTTPIPAVTLPSQTAVSTRSVPVATAPRPQPEPARSTIPAPVVIPAAVPTRSGPPPPVVTAPRPQPEPASITTPAPAQSSASAPVVPTLVSTPPATKSKTGKKRGRPRKNQVATNGTKSHKGKGKAKAKKTQKQQASDEADELLDDDEVFDMYAFSSNSDTEESPSKKTARRAANGRRRGVTDRTRHSLTVDRLVGMGFTKEDAEASVKEIGDDPDACMIWIIAKIEERQFTQDLNEASIQSEQSKRDEEKRVKEVEMETLVHAEKFMALFPTSYIACSESSASHLKKFLHSTIDQVDGETYIRKILTSLLTLEGKSIRWYKQAVRSYMLELAGRLDAALGDHDVMTCCARVSSQNADPSDVSCDFMRKILEEDKALTTALFEMPTNQGGVPPVFLECDEATKFDLDDDGFEVVEPDT
ncbi:hypothetical protein PF008_g11497 [Phytophthora fragariae]|uniref:PDZ domain-containing protein n=1 Tax=Phytophthora fragariae TaxID=53985 RepID=A0A6G0RQT3_9STRA|nr:hypothetical protein PF008_g11497 [Phytophthora fragariae]